MKQSIFDSAKQTKESAQSFVLRIWQEKPGHWRGTIQHVQSQTRRGFERLEQAQQFIERYLPSSAHTPNQSMSFPGWLRKPTFKPALALIALIVVVVGVMLLSNSYSAGSASGTSISIPSLDSILVFLTGAVLGGSAVGVVLRLLK